MLFSPGIIRLIITFNTKIIQWFRWVSSCTTFAIGSHYKIISWSTVTSLLYKYKYNAPNDPLQEPMNFNRHNLVSCWWVNFQLQQYYRTSMSMLITTALKFHGSGNIYHLYGEQMLIMLLLTTLQQAT